MRQERDLDELPNTKNLGLQDSHLWIMRILSIVGSPLPKSVYRLSSHPYTWPRGGGEMIYPSPSPNPPPSPTASHLIPLTPPLFPALPHPFSGKHHPSLPPFFYPSPTSYTEIPVGQKVNHHTQAMSYYTCPTSCSPVQLINHAAAGTQEGVVVHVQCTYRTVHTV